MKLKDVKINAEELLKFMQEKIIFEDLGKSDMNLSFAFYYKVRISELAEFINQQSKKPDELGFKFSGKDLVGVVNRNLTGGDKLQGDV